MLLKNLIGETYHPKNKDEQDFWAKHKVELFQNKYSTAEYDPVFQGSKIKVSPREADRHGYSGAPSPKNPMDKSPEGNDEKHYEEVETEGDVVDEAHSKMQADQAATYHKLRGKRAEKDVDDFEKRADKSYKWMGVTHAQDKVRAKLKRKAELHKRAEKAATKLAGDRRPLANKTDKPNPPDGGYN